VVPGVVVLEEVALALRSAGGGRLARIATVKFVAPLLPGEDAEVRLETHAHGWCFRVLRGDSLLAEGRAEVTP
jgi:hypothetical protein